MKKKKLLVNRTDDGIIATLGKEQVELHYPELMTLSYEIAHILAEVDSDDNNRIPENIPMDEDDIEVNAKKYEAVAYAEVRATKVADVMFNHVCKANIPIEGTILNIIKAISMVAFTVGWESAYDDYELIKKSRNE